MTRTLRVLARIAGSVVGLLLGGHLLFQTTVAVITLVIRPSANYGLFFLLIVCGIGAAVIGATVGAAMGAHIVDSRSSFGKALLGAVAGLLTGCILPLCLFCAWLRAVDSPTYYWAAAIAFAALPITVGAVLGSGWRAKPAKATGSLS